MARTKDLDTLDQIDSLLDQIGQGVAIGRTAHQTVRDGRRAARALAKAAPDAIEKAIEVGVRHMAAESAEPLGAFVKGAEELARYLRRK